MVNSIKNLIINSFGIKTTRKIIVFLVDDYGTIRIASNQALQQLEKIEPSISDNRFNKYDALASAEDLSSLFEVLTSVKDKNGNSAVFTPLTVVANPDFNLIEQNNFSEYSYETFFDTLKRTESYNSVIALWQEGIENNIFVPEFHGREHLNVRFWMEFLQKKDKNIVEAFKLNSIGVSPSQKSKKDYMAAFDIQDKNHLEEVIEIAAEGLQIFQDLFGYKSLLFTPSSLIHNNGMHQSLRDNSIELIDMARQRIEPNIDGNFKKRFHYMGQKNNFGQRYITRNVMFEPNKDDKDSVAQALEDIAVAFKYKKPAIISSHRVNFVGGKSESNRTQGLNDLKNLLEGIINKWPEVEFMTIRDLNIELIK